MEQIKKTEESMNRKYFKYLVLIVLSAIAISFLSFKSNRYRHHQYFYAGRDGLGLSLLLLWLEI